jgi:hypothetical protein
MSNEEKIAALEREVAELKAAVAPKPEPDWRERERADAEHQDRVHQMRERQANAWMPPSAVQDLVAGEPKGFMAGVVQDNRNAPTSPTGMIPTQREGSAGGSAVSPGTGYVAPTPLGPQPGIGWVDAQMIADEVRQRAELKRKLGE